MSKLVNVENGALIEGYDNLAAVQWCTPSFLGCNACVSVSAVKGQVTITIGLNTPFGNVSKSFNFNANVSFTWQPISKFKITVNITNFNEVNGVFSFDLGLNPCVDVPFLGWKCFSYSHHFVVPTVLNGIQNDIDDSHFSSILALHAGGALNNSCTDCGDKSSSNLLQGDIYSNYLSNQSHVGAFPTLSCVPTLQCIPTTISCIPTAQCTGVPVICGAQNATLSDVQNAVGFPTIPVASCIPTRQCVPTITSCVTGVPIICAAQHDVQNTAGFPTIPVASCIPTRQCVPTITSCVTGVSPICAAQQNNANTTQVAAIPTLPVSSCVPTASCIPTISCIPTVSCTGIPFVC